MTKVKVTATTTCYPVLSSLTFQIENIMQYMRAKMDKFKDTKRPYIAFKPFYRNRIGFSDL